MLLSYLHRWRSHLSTRFAVESGLSSIIGGNYTPPPHNKLPDALTCEPPCFNPRSPSTLSIVGLGDKDGAQDTINTIHGKGAAAVCYISIGTIEDWRSDATDFPEAAIGNDVDGWPGERWIDVKNNVRR